MINDTAKLMNDMNVVTSIVAPDVDEVKLMHRLEEILSNYDVKRKQDLDIEDDTQEKISIFLSAKEIAGLSQKTLDGYSMELEMFADFTKKAIANVRTHDIRMFLASGKQWQLSTVDKKLSVLRSFFGWLVKNEVILRDPTAKVETPKIPKRLPKYLTIEELEIVRDSCETLRERALVEVMYSTGCRLAEVANLKRSDVDHRSMSASIIGKGNVERIVYFSFRAMHHLNKYLNQRKEGTTKESDYLFLRERRPFTKLSDRSIQRMINGIEKRADISKKITPHVFRHTFASLGMENGADLVDIQRLLGHESPETTQIYAHVSEERKRQAHRRYHVQ